MMNKLLNHEPATPLLQAAARRKPSSRGETGREPAAEACNFRQLGALTSEQIQALRSIHESLARALTTSLGLHLHRPCEVALESVEQKTCPEFIAHLPEPHYVCSVVLHPLEVLATVQLDLTLALPLIDMLMGGLGGPVSEVRELTDIEQEILGSLVQLIFKELETTWQPFLKVEFRCLRRQRQDQLQRLLPPKERVLLLALEIHTSGVQGLFKMALPAVVTNALTNKPREHNAECLPARRFTDNPRLRKTLEQCRFRTELLLPEVPVAARKLMHLRVGEVLELPYRAAEPILFKVENQTLFWAQPVATGEQRAAEMCARVPAPRPVKEETN